MKFKRILCAALSLALMFTMLSSLCGCGGQKTYRVTVKDYFGTPFSDGVIVLFTQGKKQVAMQACDENGVAEKKLDKGDYTVTLKPTDDEIELYYEEVKLTPKENEKDVIVAQVLDSKPLSLSVREGEESVQYDAYEIGVGCTYVELEAKKRNYFIFTPDKAGTYEFSAIENPDITVGYYGSPSFVQEANLSESKDGVISISVSSHMIGAGEDEGGTSKLVIGFDSPDGKTDSCIIGVNRVGDAAWSIEDEPWDVYEAKCEMKEYNLPSGAQLKEFDLTEATDKYKVVFSEEDGYYHLDSENGPLVLIRLAEDSEYIDSFKTMLDRSGVIKYFYDKDGKFEKKQDYSNCLLEYIKLVDPDEGVYPLNEDLYYILTQRGEHTGWWDRESSGYIFKDAEGNVLPEINPELGWLFMCCYIG